MGVVIPHGRVRKYPTDGCGNTPRTGAEIPHEWYANVPHEWYANVPHEWYANVPHEWYANVPHEWYANVPHEWYVNVPIRGVRLPLYFAVKIR
ncbi:hypothetical protein JCM15908A_17450 [Prevotella dentasini JCM 15908]